MEGWRAANSLQVRSEGVAMSDPDGADGPRKLESREEGAQDQGRRVTQRLEVEPRSPHAQEEMASSRSKV